MKSDSVCTALSANDAMRVDVMQETLPAFHLCPCCLIAHSLSPESNLIEVYLITHMAARKAGV